MSLKSLVRKYFEEYCINVWKIIGVTCTKVEKDNTLFFKQINCYLCVSKHFSAVPFSKYVTSLISVNLHMDNIKLSALDSHSDAANNSNQCKKLKL